MLAGWHHFLLLHPKILPVYVSCVTTKLLHLSLSSYNSSSSSISSHTHPSFHDIFPNMLLPSWYLPSLMGVLFYFMIKTFFLNLYRPNGTSVPANVLLFGWAVQRLYRCVILLLKAPSKHKFKTIVLFECLEFFYWLLRLSEIDF
jgi:hypothetical protein